MAEAGVDRDLPRLLLVLRLAGRQGFADLPARRRGFQTFIDRLPAPPPCRVASVELGGVPAERVEPAAGLPASAPTILYLHGGGYCLGSPATHRALAARLAHHAGAAVVLPDYRLAPEHPFPAAFEDALVAWEALAGTADPARLALGGDSAGGGLALAVASSAARRAATLPAALFVLSPWTDLGSTASSIDGRAGRDPLVDRASLEGMAALYLQGSDARDPRASPLYGELAGLPPTLVQVGEAECLYDDAALVARALAAAGVAVSFEPWPDLVHVWPLYAGILDAGERALARVAEFVRRHVEVRPTEEGRSPPYAGGHALAR
ncbi:MAG TPA: alpha/beta hydrolase [Thermoanaerobaculia bacterium]|jgi:acetyl esterase/lipase|nr:alpha/beta hydrolase [Thermoanaerobaculia bacterium]